MLEHDPVIKKIHAASLRIRWAVIGAGIVCVILVMCK